MLVKGTEDHVDNLEDILRFPKLKILAERMTAFEHFIMKPTTPLFKNLQRQVVLIQGSNFPGAVQDDMFDRVERGGHVLLHERYFQDATLAGRYAKRGQCRFRQAPRGLRVLPVGMMLRKSLNPDIKRTINSQCYAEEPEEAAAYRLEDMQGAFCSLVLGLALALMIFMMELAVNRSAQSKLRRRLLQDSGR
ncbi:hypothetical protein MTO96_024939 [Rhipicephalus appendiculatus]